MQRAWFFKGSFAWILHAWRCHTTYCIPLRLRAAVFINLVRMREAISLHRGNHCCTLSQNNILKLQEANFLYHSALNSLTLKMVMN